MNKQRRFPSLSRPPPAPPSGWACPSSPGAQMAAHQTGWREAPNYPSLLTRGLAGEGRHGSSVGCGLLALSCPPNWGAEVRSNPLGSAGALAHLPPAVGGHRWSALTGEEKVAGKACRQPCCSLQPVGKAMWGMVGE